MASDGGDPLSLSPSHLPERLLAAIAMDGRRDGWMRGCDGYGVEEQGEGEGIDDGGGRQGRPGGVGCCCSR